MSVLKAIAQFQKEFKGVERKRQNTFTKSMYANLDDVMNAAKKALESAGLVVYQPLKIVDGEQIIETRVVHIESGEVDISQLRLKEMLEKSTSQGIGSAITYARRYAICAHLNIVETEDDDGNACEQAPEEPVDERQLTKIYDLMEATDTTDDNLVAFIEKTYKRKSIHNLSYSQAQNIIKMLEAKYDRAKN